MEIIFVTGLSGVGKSTVLRALGKEGYKVVDTDEGYTMVQKNGGIEERVLDEEKITRLIMNCKHDLILSGCYSNQVKFYEQFKHVVLLKADLDVMLTRINDRTSNHYGKRPDERSEVINSYEHVLPLLETSSDIIIDTTHTSVKEVC